MDDDNELTKGLANDFMSLLQLNIAHNKQIHDHRNPRMVDDDRQENDKNKENLFHDYFKRAYTNDLNNFKQQNLSHSFIYNLSSKLLEEEQESQYFQEPKFPTDFSDVSKEVPLNTTTSTSVLTSVLSGGKRKRSNDEDNLKRFDVQETQAQKFCK
mmetsp:Transcript_13799/g.20908  ORF Transcript_13799/g.20908 Transcript_13799/m.20908 type:complete len:156 (+) Transcript_13799:9-476(+)